MLKGGAPALDYPVQGQLGRPLSEAPEFWRPAPEAAMMWGGEEFDYPPAPRGGARDHGDRDFDLMQSAAGHVRAAGMRL